MKDKGHNKLRNERTIATVRAFLQAGEPQISRHVAQKLEIPHGSHYNITRSLQMLEILEQSHETTSTGARKLQLTENFNTLIDSLAVDGFISDEAIRQAITTCEEKIAIPKPKDSFAGALNSSPSDYLIR